MASAQSQPMGLYVARLDLQAVHHSGVAKKIRLQRDAFQEHGLACRLLYMAGNAICLDEEILQKQKRGVLARKAAIFDFYKFMEHQSNLVDFLYVRHQRASPALVQCLKRIRTKKPLLPIYIEFPTWPPDGEAKGLRNITLMYSDRFWRRYLVNSFDRAVTFTDHLSILGSDAIRIDNGIDVISQPIIRSAAATTHLGLIGLANLSHWHGYDRVIEGLHRYRCAGGSGVHFHVVGTGAEQEHLQNLTNKRGLQDTVTFHGHLSGEPLNELMSECHLAIGSIGMHRIGISEASPLKAREFCARGQPFLIGYKDRDFPPEFPYALSVEASDAPVDVNILKDFVRTLSAKDPRFRDNMRSYAEERLSWKYKIKPIIEDLQVSLGRDTYSL